MLQNSHTFYFISVSSVNSPSLSMKADSIVLLFFRLLRRFTWVLNCSDGGQHAPSEVQFLWGSSCLQCFPHTHQHTGIQTLKTFLLILMSAPSSPGLGISSARSVHVPAGPHGFASSEKHTLLVGFYVWQMIINLRLFRHFTTHLSLVRQKKKKLLTIMLLSNC